MQNVAPSELDEACPVAEKLDVGWMRKHRDSLVWYDADYFDGAIEEKCIEFCSKEARETHNGDYFQFLLDKYD